MQSAGWPRERKIYFFSDSRRLKQHPRLALTLLCRQGAHHLRHAGNGSTPCLFLDVLWIRTGCSSNGRGNLQAGFTRRDNSHQSPISGFHMTTSNSYSVSPKQSDSNTPSRRSSIVNE